MPEVIHSTTIGSMEEDRIWSVYLEWQDLPELFNDPQAWAKSLTDANGASLNAKLADGIIAIVVLYPLDRAPDVYAPPLVVQGGDFASVLQVRAVSSAGMPTGDCDPYLWLQPNGTQPGIPVTEVQITIRPIDRLGFLHFPLNVTRIGDTVAEIAQNPQRLVYAVAEWEKDGRVPVKQIEIEAGTKTAPTKSIQLSNIDETVLKKLCLVYHIGATVPPTSGPDVSAQTSTTSGGASPSASVGAAATPGAGDATCSKVSGTLADNSLLVDTIVFYRYANGPSPTPTPVPPGTPGS